MLGTEICRRSNAQLVFLDLRSGGPVTEYCPPECREEGSCRRF